MTINFKPISVYQEFDPYDIDVDNRPLLDIQDNISEIASLLGDLGFYSEIQADPSMEPAGGFTPFTCACVYSNNLLQPIDISKSIFIIDYATYPIVLVLGPKNSTTKTYPCLFFSAGITLSNKFASFVPGSQGRLLAVGPGGELVDQMYYNLANASKGYQTLYVGKILGPTSIVFGGNQVSILGNNFYLAKNRDDTTSGLITVQRSNADSNTVFKAINVNELNSLNPYAEYINSSVFPNNSSASPSPVYFSISQLPFDQSTGSFIIQSQSLEASLNELHFSTPTISTYNGAGTGATQAQIQTYLTAGVNVRSLLDFASVNTIHAPSYSNNVFEVGQGISTKLFFMDRPKIASSDPDIPIGIQYNSPIASIGSVISASSNQPSSIIPLVDTTGITISDYFNTAGGYIGGIQDTGYNADGSTRITPAADAAKQASAGFMGSGILNNATKTFINSSINDYSNSFTLLISTKSTTATPSNIAINTDGYLNLSSVNGTLVNKMPVLDTEITPKIYVDNAVYNVTTSANSKIPLTGTTDTTDSTISTPVTGVVAFDVRGNANSLTQVLKFDSNTSADILSSFPVHFFDSTGSTYQKVFAENTAFVNFPDTANLSGNKELVNKDFLVRYVVSSVIGAGYVTTAEVAGVPQIISGDKNITGLFSFQNSTTNTASTSNFELNNTTTPGAPITFTVASNTVANVILDNSNPVLTINSVNPIQLNLSTQPTDPDLSLVTKDYVDKSTIAGLAYKYTDGAGSSHDLYPGGGLKGVETYGYSILGDIAHCWIQTQTKPIPTSAQDGGWFWDPEWDIELPPLLFSTVFTVQATMNTSDTSIANAYWDTWIQIVGFNPITSCNKIRIKWQNVSPKTVTTSLSALIFIVGKLGNISIV